MTAVYHPAGPPATPPAVVIRPMPAELPTLLLAPGEVHVWVAPLDPALPEAPDFLAPLSEDELARFRRYTHTRAKAQFARSRVALRTLLAGYTGARPADVRFGYATDGKPELAGSSGAARVEFNLSHTDGFAVVAVAAVPVGVDVEHGRVGETADALVGRFFAPPEREQYRELPAELRPAAFLRGWTCKEAILKGVGCGARGLEGVVVDLDPRRPPRVVRLGGPAASRGPGWALTCWDAAPGVAAAIAVSL